MPDSRPKLALFVILSGMSIWSFFPLDSDFDNCEKCAETTCFLNCLDKIQTDIFYVYVVMFLIIIYTIFAFAEKCIFKIKKRKFEALLEEI